MKNKEIAFWGTEPPPLGGMTVHIKRLSNYLIKYNWQVIQYNFKKEKRNKSYIVNVKNLWLWYMKLWFCKSPRVHYVITTTTYVRFLAALLSLRGKKIVLRVGGRSLENGINSNIFEKYLTIISLKLCSRFIGVNKDICELAEIYTFKKYIYHIPGFIPPIMELEAPNEIQKFFNDKNSLKLVITGQIVNEDEEDIYGLFHALETLKALTVEGFDFKCCIVSYTISGDNSLKIRNYKNKINLNALNDNVLLYHSIDELWPILKISDIFIRSSITDGDANSIREALHLDKIVIASNCVQRPEECLLYKTLDSVDLKYKIINHKQMNENSNHKKLNNQESILNLLNELIE